MILCGKQERQKTPLYIHVIDGMHTVHVGKAALREKLFMSGSSDTSSTL